MTPQTTVLLATGATVAALVLGVYLWQPYSRARRVAVSTHDADDHHEAHVAAVVKAVAAVTPPDGGPQTQEAQEWAALYARMAAEFKANDLNAKAIEPLVSWFHGVDVEGETPWPKKYPELDEPLQFGAVRLLVIPLDDSPVILRIAAAVTADVMRLLPEGVKVFANARGNYHCTVFHTSQPTDPRPDPATPNGGVDLAAPPAARRLPTASEWARELAMVQKLVADTPVPTLRLERVVQASTGVLLLTWTEVGTNSIVTDLRARLRKAFPGASTKQASIIHSSLLRIVTPHPLGAAAVEAVSAACERWTERLRGTLYKPKTLWFIREAEFSTITGEREVLTLADPTAPLRHW
ncbi:hypothetical protein HYH03_007715 [Edaphochlamys debaryana]|uniref:Uncharacterized protein n=1 Tax=Edaphochlamys debaryana TaxID=47281 RepID=A0A835XZV0_9CHLO|nr:hypothetical protein HYH03_007715 [Edaphochlamys debaryana]|eukprot:KAG2494072.1 hypothetical protein HYH03_007715 [Edaphochlamys debaryana]